MLCIYQIINIIQCVKQPWAKQKHEDHELTITKFPNL